MTLPPPASAPQTTRIDREAARRSGLDTCPAPLYKTSPLLAPGRRGLSIHKENDHAEI